jgi:hypothetical protein
MPEPIVFGEYSQKIFSLLNNLNGKTTEWPRVYSCNFIEPGLVSYEEQGLGKCFVSKETLDKMNATFVGKPVVLAKDHVDGMKPEDFEKVAVGVVTRTYFNEQDGWFWADFIPWDDKVRKQIDDEGYSVSCAYKVLSASDKGGIRNNIKFDQEVLEGEYTHLAIVPNPRYNGARIILNSLQGGTMKFKAWIKRLPAALKNAIATAESSIDIDGEKVPMKDIVSSVEEEQAESAEKAKKEAEAKAAADKEEPKEEDLGEESTLTIGGKEVKIADAVNCYKNRKARKNAADVEAKKKADEEAATKKAEEEKKNAEDAEKKKKDEEAKAAADKETADKAEKEKKDAEEKKNSLEAEKEKHFRELKNKADNRGELGTPSVVEDKRAKGQELYGTKNGGK